jgi:two-component system chemotaxis response regulator CheY
MHDNLTGLFDRRAMEDHATVELSRARRSGAPLSVILLDLDHFRTVNDRYGHAVGDQALRFVAGILAQQVRAYDWVGRWGGEEFLLVLPGATLEDAGRVAERIRQSIATAALPLVDEHERPVRLTVSLGVANAAHLAPQPSLDQLAQAVDAALYRAKRDGRNRVCLASEVQ